MTAKKTASKPKSTPKSAPKKTAPAAVTATPLKKPLTPAQVKVLAKMGDTDRAIAARVGKALASGGLGLDIAGVSGEGILQGVRESEAIIAAERALEQEAARLMGARLVADDKVWKAVTKLHRRLADEGDDYPEALARLEFLMDYISKRSQHRGSAAPADPTATTKK